MRLAAELRDAGIAIEHLDFGGGVGIAYDGGVAPDPTDYVRRIVRAAGGSGLKLAIEPGRVLVGAAGVLLTRVVDVKQFPGARRFVVLDAGMTELMRPALYGAFHRIEPVQAAARRAGGRGHRRAHLREHGHVRARPRAAAGGSRRPDRRSATAARMRRRWARTTCAGRCRPRCSSKATSWRVTRRRQTLDDMLALES